MKPWALVALSLGAVAASGTAAWWVGRQYEPEGTRQALERDGAALLARSFPDPAGATRPLADLKGKVAVVNFWATWCAPCREEMPAFSRLHAQLAPKGVQFVGIGIDSAAKILQFSTDTPVSYPLLVGDITAIDLTRDFGNSMQALPFTVVLDRDGRVAATRLGRYDEHELATLLTRLL